MAGLRSTAQGLLVRGSGSARTQAGSLFSPHLAALPPVRAGGRLSPAVTQPPLHRPRTLWPQRAQPAHGLHRPCLSGLPITGLGAGRPHTAPSGSHSV